MFSKKNRESTVTDGNQPPDHDEDLHSQRSSDALQPQGLDDGAGENEYRLTAGEVVSSPEQQSNRREVSMYFDDSVVHVDITASVDATPSAELFLPDVDDVIKAEDEKKAVRGVDDGVVNLLNQSLDDIDLYDGSSDDSDDSNVIITKSTATMASQQPQDDDKDIISPLFPIMPQSERPISMSRMTRHHSISTVYIDIEDDGASYTTLPLRSQSRKELISAFGLPEEPVKEATVLHRQSTLATEYASTPKKGWLYKRGGQWGNKGWDHRYFTFEGDRLSYYVREKDARPQGEVLLHNMMLVKASPEDKLAKFQYRFEVVTPSRTYYLAATSAQEMTEWMIYLGVLIDSVSASQRDALAAGFTSRVETEKAGYIKARDPTKHASAWSDHYLAIKQGFISAYHVSQ